MHSNEEEIKYLDKHDEVADQFDYSYTQVNQVGAFNPPTQTTPAQAIPSVLSSAMVVQPAGPLPLTTIQPVSGATAYIRSPKYWLPLVVILVSYFTIIVMLPDGLGRVIASFVYTVALVATSNHVASLRRIGKDSIGEGDKFKMIISMSLNPVLSQIIYYSGLHKTLPSVGKVAVKIGWKTLVLVIICLFLASGFALSRSWTFNNGSTFNKAERQLKTDMTNAVASAHDHGETAALVKDTCDKLANDLRPIKGLPPYPDVTIQAELQKALSEFGAGVNDCLSAIDQSDADMLKQSGNELTQGAADFKKSVQDMNNANK